MEGEPRVRRPAGRPPYPNPSRKEDSWSSALSLLVVLSLVLPAAATALRPSTSGSKARPRPSSARPTRRQRDERPGRAGAGVDRRRVLLPRHRHRASAPTSTRSAATPATRSSGWVFKVNNVSPPVGADQVTLKDGDNVLWYYATFGPNGGPPTLQLNRGAGGCYRVTRLRRRRQAGARSRACRSTSARSRRCRRDRPAPRCAPARTSGCSSGPPRRVRSARTR